MTFHHENDKLLGPIVRGVLTFESGQVFEVSARIRQDGIHSTGTMICLKKRGWHARSMALGLSLLTRRAADARENGWHDIDQDWLRMTPNDVDTILAWLTEEEDRTLHAFWAQEGSEK